MTDYFSEEVVYQAELKGLEESLMQFIKKEQLEDS